MTATTHSALYVGRVSHRRFAPTQHGFDYSLFMVYLDLDELPRVLDGIPAWSARRPALAEFRRSDHFGDPSESLRSSIEALLTERGINAPGGPIRLLTHLRYAGFVFNPVSFYFCFPADTSPTESIGVIEPEVIVAEVDNTPWGERHLYVLPRAEARVDTLNSRRSFIWDFEKAFHVSPFLPMDQRYRWRFQAPGEHLSVTMANYPNAGDESARRCFEAHLELQRKPLDTVNAWSALLQFPLMTGKVFGAIYWNALRLWLKRTPFHPHPRGNSGFARGPVALEETRHEPKSVVV